MDPSSSTGSGFPAGLDPTTPEGKAALTEALLQLKQLYVAVEHLTATKVRSLRLI